MLLQFSDFFFLKESKGDTAVLSFGRMNPPTVGHQKLMKKIVEVSKKEGGVPMLFLSHSQDKKKNPLSYKDKLRFVRLLSPSGLRVMDTPNRTIYDVVGFLVELGYTNIIVVCGSDRISEFSKIENYKDKFGFSSFKVVSSGERDSDSGNIESSISASKMRDYVKNDDYESFSRGVRCSDDIKREMFDLIRKGI